MSDIVGEIARVTEAFQKPTLRLLDGKWAAFRVAVFRAAFSRDRRSVPADRLHAQVDTYLTELLREGLDVPPVQNGRALCNTWVNDQWLFRDNDADGALVYSLTSSALEALDLVATLSRDRVLVSESRLTTILDTVRRWALEASPDAQARVDRLNAQIRELEVERDRLANGGEVMLASDDRMLDGYANLIDLIGQLPSDFKRVEESVLDMHRKILRDFRDEERPVTDVLDEYLHKQDTLVKDTAEGRAFDGAFVLLRDDDMLLQLRTNVQVLMDHPASACARGLRHGRTPGRGGHHPARHQGRARAAPTPHRHPERAHRQQRRAARARTRPGAARHQPGTGQVDGGRWSARHGPRGTAAAHHEGRAPPRTALGPRLRRTTASARRHRG